jgi:hypothetical protein
MPLLEALENSAFAIWLQESGSVWGYPTVLTLHTVGLAVLVGANWFVALRVLGFARGIPLERLRGSFRVMWIGFWINALSGVMLFVGDATTKGTLPLFLWKLGFVGIGVLNIAMLRRLLFGPGAAPQTVPAAARLSALATLPLWMAAIVAGRFMAYAGY